ncbi:conserved hypothetical protein [gamma proteobacterium HdN1]|nr:conserved hypothetical protein [gamma proteobacterium HdN1]
MQPNHSELPLAQDPTPASTQLQHLNSRLHQMLSDASLAWQKLPQCPEIGLWLLDPALMQRSFSSDEIARIQAYPAYWAFCWASGQRLAAYLLHNQSLVAGKKVLDFGAGSGVAGIAAAKAGAAEVVFCDIDQDAIDASLLNAQANAQEAICRTSHDVFALQETFDVVLAADVLYDRANLPLLDHLLRLGRDVWVADSRIRDFSRPGFSKVMTAESFTMPDLDESCEFRRVTLYRGALYHEKLAD